MGLQNHLTVLTALSFLLVAEAGFLYHRVTKETDRGVDSAFAYYTSEVDTAGECCLICSADVFCLSFTLQKNTTFGAATLYCHLFSIRKEQAVTLAAVPGCTYYIKAGIHVVGVATGEFIGTGVMLAGTVPSMYPDVAFTTPGTIIGWIFCARQITVDVIAAVWRPSGGDWYQIIGKTHIPVTSTGRQVLYLDGPDRIDFQAGDMLGTHFPLYDTSNYGPLHAMIVATQVNAPLCCGLNDLDLSSRLAMVVPDHDASLSVGTYKQFTPSGGYVLHSVSALIELL